MQEGEILIDGINIKDLGVHDLRQLIGNVNQEAILFNDSFKNNISFGVNATDEAIVEAAKIANAHEFIMHSERGYDTNIGDRGGRLSGGQRQPVAHRLSTIKNSDEICVLHEGEIVERGTHDELMDIEGYYKKLHDMQEI